MAFDDISEFREALAIIPNQALNSSQRSILWVIISYPEGCFIGQEKLAHMAGMKVSTLESNLTAIYRLNLLYREQNYARKGLRQCWHVNMQAVNNLADKYEPERVRISAPKELERVRIPKAKGADKKPKGADNLANGSNTPQAYKDNKDYKYDKELFDEFIGGLKDQGIGQFVQGGYNLDILLNAVIQKDGSFRNLHDYLSKQKFGTAEKVGGLMVHLLNVYLGNKKNHEKAGMPKWCGQEGCDPVTRMWDMPSIDKDGKPYYECNACNPKGINRARVTGEAVAFNDDPWASSAPSGGGWDIGKITSEMFKLPE